MKKTNDEILSEAVTFALWLGLQGIAIVDREDCKALFDKFMQKPEAKKITYNIDGRTWTFRKDLPESEHWTADWFCSDGDGVALYIEKDLCGFELRCFSGTPASNICIDSVDFGVLWNKVFCREAHLEPIQQHSHVQRCLIIADYICSKFCEFTDVSNYKLKTKT